MNILGIWDGHDAGAALLIDGRIAAAANEERFTRRKLEIQFPARSIEACLALANLPNSAVDVVASTTSDVAKTLARVAPSTKQAYYRLRRRQAAPTVVSMLRRRAKYLITEWKPNAITRLGSRWALRRAIAAAGMTRADLRIFDHHECHAAAAAWASGYDSCLVISIDGLGDGIASTVSRFHDGRLERLASTPARHSPGVFFEHVTHLLNMRELEDEGKVMALADYASPVPDADNPLLEVLTARGMTFATSAPGHRLLGPLRKIHWRFPNEQFAFMAQRALERAAVAVVQAAVRHTGKRRIALAGGVASNVKMNRRIRLIDGVDDVYVFPHMGDGGLALGAAMLALDGDRHGAALPRGVPSGDLDDLGLGPSFPDEAIETALRERGVRFQHCPDLPATVAGLLTAEKIVMWFQGGMEYGPRALGHRSILARADRPALRDRLNLVQKRRVWYQPFCPSLLESDARAVLADFTGRPNRHMTMAYEVAPEHRPRLSGVINVDGTCRPQMVADVDTGPYAALLREMRARVGIGAVLNTSFNIHGAPLVCTPREAIDVFVETGADALAIGPFLACRSEPA